MPRLWPHLARSTERNAMFFEEQTPLGRLVAQLVKRPTLAQVMNLRFPSSSPTSGSALTPRSLLGILSLPLSLALSLTASLSLSLPQK